MTLGDRARYVGIGHGSAEEKAEAAGDLAEKHVVVLDFSFDAPTTAAQLATSASYAVLDHHKSAQLNLEALPAANKVFEMKMSGATLAWNFFHPGKPCPLLARYVEDKDIWRWAYHSSKEFSAVFDLSVQVPSKGEVSAEDFAALDALHQGGDTALQSLLAQGSTLLTYQESLIASHARKATLRRLREFPELQCAVVNSTVLASEIGNRATQIEGAAFAVIFRVFNGDMSVSLRSCFPSEGQADVSQIAAKFGGGGHQAASGCRFNTSDIETLLLPSDDKDEGDEKAAKKQKV